MNGKETILKNLTSNKMKLDANLYDLSHILIVWNLLHHKILSDWSKAVKHEIVNGDIARVIRVDAEIFI